MAHYKGMTFLKIIMQSHHARSIVGNYNCPCSQQRLSRYPLSLTVHTALTTRVKMATSAQS